MKWQPTPVFLPGESPWKEEPGGLKSMGSQRAGHDRETKQRIKISWPVSSDEHLSGIFLAGKKQKQGQQVYYLLVH